MDLYKELLDGLSNTYSPYSNFGVCAVIVLKNGKIIKGVNVENVSFGLTICAERAAIFNLISNGYNKDDVSMMGIISSGDDIITPCGACRQVLIELLNQDTIIRLYNKEGKSKDIKVCDLLPFSFRRF